MPVEWRLAERSSTWLVAKLPDGWSVTVSSNLSRTHFSWVVTDTVSGRLAEMGSARSLTAAQRAGLAAHRAAARLPRVVKQSRPCGSASGYRRHKAEGSPICEPCRDAFNFEGREARRLRVARQKQEQAAL